MTVRGEREAQMTGMDRRSLLVAGGVLGVASQAWATPGGQAVTVKTATYASPGGKDLLLDLYLPEGLAKPAPVILFLHGGGWSGGTRLTGPDFKRFFARDGFAMVAIEYRLTPSITFPANAADVKTAIRWLRANAGAYNIDPRRIGLWGTSAGGHLSAIVGLTPRGLFEGEGNLDRSSAVQCVLDAYGPSLFTAMDAETDQEAATLQPTAQALVQPAAGPRPPAGGGRHDEATSGESRLVGAPIQTVPDRVKAASPLTYVKKGAPPFLLMHGLADNTVPHGQSVLLYEALASAGNEASLRLVDGLPHTFFNRTSLDDLAGPFRMDVRDHPAGGAERRSVDRAGVFDVARAFFTRHLA
jgi:acetyl esterase/lipase